MTFLEALYGSQYYEIEQRGKDGNKGRLNANFFLTALIILAIIAVAMICLRFVPGLNDSLTENSSSFLVFTDGKTIGKLLALPIFGIIYFVIIKTVGNEHNFKRRTEAFMQLPDEVKKKANAKLLTPFFILLVIILVLALWK
jgi:NADH:ubiquinone oxidoreductase subunit 6 (subunit J)